MRLDIAAALREGFDRTMQRNALLLVGVFVGFQLTNAVIGESMTQELLRTVDYQTVLADLEPELAAEFEATLAEATRFALLDLPLWGLLAASFGVFVLKTAVKVGTLRTFVSDETERLPRELFTRRLGWAVAHLIVGTIIYAILVGVGLLLFVLPGVFLAVALFFFNYRIVVEDENAVEALSASWGLTAGNRLALFLLGAIVAIIGFVAGWIGGIVGVADPVVGLVVQSVISAAITVFGIAVAARAYDQLTTEPSIEDDEVGALGPDDLD